MAIPLENVVASDGDRVSATDMKRALTAADLVFGDGATQRFTGDGRTTYDEGGRTTQGEWAVIDDGRFSSFWPPSYRATYDVRWRVDHGLIVGLVFTDAHGTRFDGRYR